MEETPCLVTPSRKAWLWRIPTWIYAIFVFALCIIAAVLALVILVACSPNGNEPNVYLLSVSFYATLSPIGTFPIFNTTLSSSRASERLGYSGICITPGGSGYLCSSPVFLPSPPFPPGFIRTLEVRTGYFGVQAWSADTGWVGCEDASSWAQDGRDHLGLLDGVDNFRRHGLRPGMMIATFALIVMVLFGFLVRIGFRNTLRYTNRRARPIPQVFGASLTILLFAAAFVAVFAAAHQCTAVNTAMSMMSGLETAQPLNVSYALLSQKGSALNYAWVMAGCTIVAASAMAVLSAVERRKTIRKSNTTTSTGINLFELHRS
ncbi:hypothetical protein NA57DRAFT_79073 [Rhizodiscina lignyota]|uniref:Uncharacterized protein n=1 Tax=Rhizodiscina lignyota TaxID=1504668 RepID=A0A9P4IAF3_9PEZI|nr:hypothetical protein NA57DRAFT_79073 [Rhizodiscina lignyota]